MRVYTLTLIVFFLLVLVGVRLDRYPSTCEHGEPAIWPMTCASYDPIPNTAEDFTLRASCKGLWLDFNDDNEDSAKLDRCPSGGPGPPSTGQNGADDLSLVPAGLEELNLVSGIVPPGFPIGSNSIRFIRSGADPSKTHYVGPDQTDNAFEAQKFTVVGWLYPRNISGFKGWIAKGALTDVGRWQTQLVSGAQYWLFSTPSPYTQYYSPTADPLTLSVNTWSFHAATLDLGDGVRKMLQDSSEATEGGLLACDDGVRTCGTAPAVTLSHVGITRMGLGWGGSADPFDGEMVHHAYFAEDLSETDRCSICRCGIKGTNSGYWWDLGTEPYNFCNSCTLPDPGGCGDQL